MTAKTLSKRSLNSNINKNLGQKITFEFYAPLANEVAIAGDFNNWDASQNKLKKDSRGNWKTVLTLNPGRYEYRLLVDGNWENDPKSTEFVPNGFGTWNCVIEVR